MADSRECTTLHRSRLLLLLLLLLLLDVQESLKLPNARGMAHLAERLGLDLPDALARDLELLSDFLQRARIAIAQPETQFEHFAFALGEARQHVAQFVLQQTVAGHLGRILRALVFD